MSGSGAEPVTDTAYGQIATTAGTVREEAKKPAIALKKQKHIAATETEAIVRAYFSDIPVMAEVSRCESTFRHTLTDGSVLRGVVDPRDTGVMQINTHYHGKTAAKLGLNLELLDDNLAYARYLYNQQGTQPWSASAPCWSKTLALR